MHGCGHANQQKLASSPVSQSILGRKNSHQVSEKVSEAVDTQAGWVMYPFCFLVMNRQVTIRLATLPFNCIHLPLWTFTQRLLKFHHVYSSSIKGVASICFSCQQRRSKIMRLCVITLILVFPVTSYYMRSQ